MTTSQQQARLTAVEKALDESKKNDVDEAHEKPEDATDSPRSKFRSIGFYRFNTHWRGDDAEVITRANRAIEDKVQERFADAYQIMHDLFMIVRLPEVDDDGEVRKDMYGWPEWQRTPSGGFVEDWSLLTRKAREDFLFGITTRMFAWEEETAQAWAEAMFAKSKWEETFSLSYIAPQTGTIDDRTAYGRTQAAEDRYFAVFLTAYSKRCDAITRVMGLLGQRLKDTFELG